MPMRRSSPWSLLVALAAVAVGCATGEETGTGPDDTGVGADGAGGDGTLLDGPLGDTGCGNTQTDPRNCGTCGHVCPSGQVCVSGKCGCTPPGTLCTGPAPGGPDAGAGEAGPGEGGPPPIDSGASHDAGGTMSYCANLQNDPTNCGQCGKSCGQDHTCTNGMCVLSCPMGTTACMPADMCITPGNCCTNADCTVAGQMCPMPGGPCVCSGTVDTYGTTCAAASAIPPVALGGTSSVTGNLPTMGAANWFSVTFTADNTMTSYHPRIHFTTNPNNEFVFDVQSSCAGGAVGCGEGGSCTGKTDYEEFYDPNQPPQPLMAVPAVGSVVVRVYRASGTPNCDSFTLTFSD